MIVRDYVDARKIFKVGDIVYACAFQYTHDKDGKYLHQEPIRGIFTLANTPAKCEVQASRGRAEIAYFVPFKKNGKDLAWSKAVLVHSRSYTTYYDECVKLYNTFIQEAINWHQNEIEELKKNLIMSGSGGC